MGLLNGLAKALGIYVEAKADTGMTSAELAQVLSRGRDSNSGARVDWGTALQVSTVLACARVLAEGVAQVPFKVYRSGGARVEAPEHPAYDLLYRRPNPWQTSFEFRETLMLHAVLTGNAVVRKLRVGAARRVAALEIIEPRLLRYQQNEDGTLRYFARKPLGGPEFEIDAKDIWHVRGPSWSTWLGLDATRLAREAIGLAIATEAAHADFHRNGARTSGFVSMDGVVTAEQYEQLDKWLERYTQNGDRAGKPLILDHDAKYQSTGMSGVDAEHIKTREFQCLEICRSMRVMPIMAGIPGAAGAYDNGESMFTAHVVHTLMPWYERLEHSADVNLLTEQDRAQGYYTKFTASALMRGSTKDRGEYFAKALGAGGTQPWMTQDEVRALEELDPYGQHAAELGKGAMEKPVATPATGA